MKQLLFIAILFLPYIANSQPQFIDAGERIVRVDFYQDKYWLTNVEPLSRLVSAINAATDAGLLKWEKVNQDSMQVLPSMSAYLRKSVKKTIVLGVAKQYEPKQGEIVVGDEDGIWKTKNLDLVVFFQLYFFGIKNETE